MKRYLLLIILSATFFLQASAQKIKVTEATSQSWAGGMCCRTGLNYHFIIQVSNYKKEIVLDSVWVDGLAIPLRESNPDGEMLQINTRKKIIDKKILRFDINLRLTYDNGKPDILPGTAAETPPWKYTGIALISFHEKGASKTRYFTIDSAKALEPINYP